MKNIAALMGAVALVAILPQPLVAQGGMQASGMAPAEGVAAKKAQKKARKKQMMMQMMQKMKAAKAARIPATMPIYDPAGGEVGRNLPRYDQPYCLNWRGGPKGVLLPADMKPPAVPPMPGLHGIVGLGYNGACGGANALLSFSNKGKSAFMRGMIYKEDNGSYTPANGGADVLNDNERLAYSIGGGLFRGDGSFVSLDLRGQRRDEVRYPGLPVSTRQLDVDRYDLAGQYMLQGGALKKLRFKANFINIDKINDNFTYNIPAGGSPNFEVRVERKTADAMLELDGGSGAFNWTVGLGYRSDNRDAGRFAFMGGAWVQNSPNFADATVKAVSLKAKGVWALDRARRIKAGLQVDSVDASLGRMNTPVAGGVTPAMMFNATYGPGAAQDEASETNVSANIRFEKDFAAKKGRFFAGLSRKLRTANPRERYFALTSPVAAASWVGNPGLSPEKHHMLEVGAGWKGGPWELAGRAYVDHVSDFILWDRIHNPASPMNGRNIFRNVDALFTGVEAKAKYKFAKGWWAGAELWLTRGENTTDDRPIDQIPAAEAALQLGWANETFALESRLRLVSEQTRLDNNPATGSGRDGASSGYGVLDISGSWKPKPNMTVSFGVDNVLDKVYTPHIERYDIANPMLSNPVAPERNIWVKATMRF
ncbi:MAG: hypothetical protein CSA68_00325 [Rhodobacterales bacterium]|nr:MAG: hypothetical protein CSA68_00325 [Rhodobacterales bacterium]